MSCTFKIAATNDRIPPVKTIAMARFFHMLDDFVTTACVGAGCWEECCNVNENGGTGGGDVAERAFVVGSDGLGQM